MLFFKTKKAFSPKQSIFRWFFIGFLCFSIIFFIALFPLYNYCRDTFTQLKIKQISQKMDFGISQLEDTVSGIMNASLSVAANTSFRSLHHLTVDYSRINVSERLQMQDYLESLIRPYELITDCALQVSENNAVTSSLITFDNPLGYYPFYFCVDNLSYDEWVSILLECSPGFLPVHHITTPNNNYDALIYSIRWSGNKYFYAVLNISDIKKSVIDADYLDDLFLTVENTHGDCLYTDFSNEPSDYHTVSRVSTSGALKVTIHIPKTTVHAHMGPLYTFISLYLTICVSILLISIYIGSRVSSKPLFKIIDRIDSKKTARSNSPKAIHCAESSDLGSGFRYIYNKIQLYESNIQDYQSTIETQAKVLQTRFMEKALHGTLSTDSDYEIFYSYFPHFPKRFYLVLLGLSEKSISHENSYPNILALLQYQFQQSFPDAYQQQLSNTSILLIIDAENHNYSFDVINQLIFDINQGETSYQIWGIASRVYDHPNKLAFAYEQVHSLKGQLSIESLSQLCAVSDLKLSHKSTFQISDTVAIYSAIVAGNNEVALLRLENYADLLIAHSRSVCEMFRALLLCIKQEYANLLLDIEIPFYNTQLDMYVVFKDIINQFCDIIRAEKEQSDSFSLQIKAYIDSHFTEDTLCSASLEKQFQCSYSKIRKVFSSSFGIPISSYIEKKRLDLSNELLISGECSISEVAKRCGYNNDSTFYKAYKRTYGHAPSSIKKD